MKRELHERDYNYESRMQDLQHELQHMRGQLTNVQKASKHHEQNSKSDLNDLNYQNNSLIQELDQVGLIFQCRIQLCFLLLKGHLLQWDGSLQVVNF